jgi:hypothetical protein
MTPDGGSSVPGGSVRPVVALAFAGIAFVALTIFGLGMTSLVTGADVIATPGLGQVPGIAGIVCALLAFAAGVWAAIGRGQQPDAAAPSATGPLVAGPDRRSGDAASVSEKDLLPAHPSQPSYWGAAWTAAACFLAYVCAVWVAAAVTGADLAVATAVAGRLATSWFGLVVAAAAFVCAWSAIALVRTRAHRPRWPWEDEDDQ